MDHILLLPHYSLHFLVHCDLPLLYPSPSPPHLQGTFAELWGAQGICAGDTLIFKRDPTTGHIQLSRLTAGSAAATAARMEEVGVGC